MSLHAVIIGGGAIGVACAYYLSRDGWQVTVTDGQDIGRGCSYANAGLIVRCHPHPLPGPGVIRQALGWMFLRDSPFFIKPRLDLDMARWGWQFSRFCRRQAAEYGTQALLALSLASTSLFEELRAFEELRFFYRREGLLDAYLSDRAFDRAQKDREMLQGLGFRVRLLPRDELLAFEPALSLEVRGALFIEGEAHGNSLEYVLALARAVERRGGRLLVRRQVSRVVVKRGRVRGVLLTAPAEEMTADLIVLAAGVWTPALAVPLGIRIPLQPGKGYSCTIDTYHGSPRIPVRISERRVVITPLGPRLRFSGTLELSGYNLQLNERRYSAVIRSARQALKEPPPLRNEEAWSGLRPLTPDGLPIIDRVAQIDGLIVATGHAMLGLMHSPITGRLVADLVQDRPPLVPLKPFRLGRF